MTFILQPSTSVNIVSANTVAENADQKILIVAQMLASGTAVAGGLTENVGLNAGDALFGATSMAAGAVRAIQAINKENQIDVIALDDNGAGVQAQGTITVSGTPTAQGTLTVIIGSKQDYSFDVAVALTDTPTIIAGAIVNAINANPNVPASASNVAGVVTMTAANDGTLGNFIGIAVTTVVEGITTAVVGMSGGANDPVLTGVFDVVGDNRYQSVVWPYADDVSELVTFLDARFNVSNKVLDGVGFTGTHDTLANHLSRLNALNSQSLVEFVDNVRTEANYAGPAMLELSYIVSSQFVAIRALRLTEGASISEFVISSNGALDSFGGPALASKPYFNTPFANLPIIDVGEGWNDQEIPQLNAAGGTVLGNNVARNTIISGEVYTTYKTDSAGNPDISFQFLNYRDTSSGAREYFFNNLRSRFAQSRLTEGDVIKGRDQANALVIQGFCEKLYQDLSGEDFVLLEAGEAALVFFKDKIVVVIDKSTGTATIQMVVPIVTQLREILATMQIAFSTEA